MAPGGQGFSSASAHQSPVFTPCTARRHRRWSNSVWTCTPWARFDLVICCRARGKEALAALQVMMTKLKLTVNETKTRFAKLPEDKFDFPGYTFGRCNSPKTGRAYLGTVPSKKRVMYICAAISTETGQTKLPLEPEKGHGNAQPNDERMGQLLLPRSSQQRLSGYRRHARRRLRQWLCRKHQLKWPAMHRFPYRYIDHGLGLVRLSQRTTSFSWAKF